MNARRIAGQTLAVAVVGASFLAVALAFTAAWDEPLPACTDRSTSACSGPIVDHPSNGAEKDSPVITPASVVVHTSATPGLPPESTQVDQPAPVTEDTPEPVPAPESTQVDQPPVDPLTRTTYDEGVLECGALAMPAIDQDEHGNWWAYCEPALIEPCVTEDSTSCYWDAATMGNGTGRSFVTDADGTIHYLD